MSNDSNSFEQLLAEAVGSHLEWHDAYLRERDLVRLKSETEEALWDFNQRHPTSPMYGMTRVAFGSALWIRQQRARTARESEVDGGAN